VSKSRSEEREARRVQLVDALDRALAITVKQLGDELNGMVSGAAVVMRQERAIKTLLPIVKEMRELHGLTEKPRAEADEDVRLLAQRLAEHLRAGAQ